MASLCSHRLSDGVVSHAHNVGHAHHECVAAIMGAVGCWATGCTSVAALWLVNSVTTERCHANSNIHVLEAELVVQVCLTKHNEL